MRHSLFSFLHANKKLLTRVAIFWIIFLLVINSSFKPLRKMITGYLADRSQSSFQTELDTELSYSSKKGDEIASSKTIVEGLEYNNTYDVLKDLSEKKKEYGLSLVTLTDSHGFVITRNSDTLPKNDNVFLSSTPGRIVMTGGKAEGYYEGPIDPTAVYMSTGRPILDINKKMIGALFVGDKLDDQYAKDIVSRNPIHGTQVVFYNKSYGVSGSSFNNHGIIFKTLQSYFNSGSNWIQNGKTDTLFAIDNQIYLLKNIQLGQNTGALLFIPMFASVRVIFVLILVSIFAFTTLIKVLKHIKVGKKSLALLHALTGMFTVVGVVTVVYFVYRNAINDVIFLKPLGRTIYNSTLRLDPSSGLFASDSDQFVSVVLDTGGETINAVETDINYDPKKLEVLNLDDSVSSCDYIIEKSIDNIKGELHFSCAMIHEPENGSNIVMAKFLIHPKSEGFASLHFASSTSVVASDGLATEVLRRTTDAGFNFINRVENIFANEEDSKDKTKKLLVYSMSHRNIEQWYSRDNIRMIWSPRASSTFRYSLSKNEPDITISNYSTTTNNYIDMKAPSDGLYYFNVAEELSNKKIGPVTSFPIRNDNIPPEEVSLFVSDTDIEHGDTVRFTVEAKDNESGIASGYYIKVDDHILYPVNGVTYMPFPEVGTYVVTARVFDKANNFSEATQTINVR